MTKMLGTIPRVIAGPAFVAIVAEACPDCGESLVIVCSEQERRRRNSMGGGYDRWWDGEISQELSECRCQRNRFAERTEVLRAIEVLGAD